MRVPLSFGAIKIQQLIVYLAYDYDCVLLKSPTFSYYKKKKKKIKEKGKHYFDSNTISTDR